MNFRDFGKYNQFKEQFAGMSPEMKEQMMRMAKEQMKARLNAFVQKWLSQPVLIVVALFLGALVGALTAFFGQVLLAVSALRDAHPLYWIPGLALIGIAIVLGYKKFGRGINAYHDSRLLIDSQILHLEEFLPQMVREKWFDSISFDNLALEQLGVKNLMPQDKWDMFYMGDEGSSTMYVDMVNREFAANSTSETRYPLLDNVEDMLNVIHQEKKGKDID